MEQQQLANVDLEKAVLGSILIDPDAFLEVRGALSETDFFLERHKAIFRAMLRLQEEGSPIDALSLSAAIPDIAAIGGEAYLIELVDIVPTSSGAGAYAATVAGLASRRRMLRALGQAAKSVHDLELGTADVESAVYQEIVSSFRSVGQGQAEGMGRVVDNYLLVAERRANSHGVISTGLLALDRILGGGFWPGELIIVGARPGMGKTALAEGILAACRHGKIHAAIFSLEMRSEALVDRYLARALSKPIEEIRRHWEMSPQDTQRYYHELMRIKADPYVFVNDDAGIQLPRLEAEITRLVMHHEVRLVVLDYIQLMDNGGGKPLQNRHLEVSTIARRLKILAQRLNISIVAVAQLSRAVESRSDKRPILSDLKESGDLEQHADVVLFPYRPGYYSQDDPHIEEDAEINVGKQRNGPAGPNQVAHVQWLGRTATFANKIR